VAKNLLKRTPFNEKHFVSGLNVFKEKTAEDFVKFVKDKIDNKKYNFKLIEQEIIRNPITKDDIKDSFIAEKGVAFVKDGKFVKDFTYKELLTILEYGRKDKNIMPQSVIRIAFEEYRPIYRKRFMLFLKGKLF
jgi:hypothetical protein